MPCYEIDGVIPVVSPGAYIHPTAVLIGDVIIEEEYILVHLPVCGQILAVYMFGKMRIFRTHVLCMASRPVSL